MAQSQNKNLHKAKKEKNDEFYTKLCDIENELKHYKDYFRGKTVLCNCDLPHSNFIKYFEDNFQELGLKKLLHSGYDKENNTGDFRSTECIELLKQADIVVTNPPFSLFREYVSQLVEHDKKFLIIGNQNAIICKEIFKLIKESKLWLGVSIHSGDREFMVPQDYPLTASGNRVDEFGNKYIRVKGISWFTNLDHNKPHEDLILYKKYTAEKYPHYDNYNAINVDKTKDIPMDWAGAMGVPITFLHKYNPEQFEIVSLGIIGSIDFTCKKKMEILDKNGKETGKYTYNAKGTLYKIFNPNTDKTPAFKDCETGVLYTSIYARIIIKNKKL
jgi:hypothetical protein